MFRIIKQHRHVDRGSVVYPMFGKYYQFWIETLSVHKTTRRSCGTDTRLMMVPAA
jgi:hypothetical protein